ncbi:sigma-54-dependent transcriptional regulator [Tautonia sociabilis]|uniref:DNA-binding transcriptional regulator NtrC n=1 Tax=Tautonia sociabilis TaxID=2080755 RepID=A0A432MEV2_9BACT|nr:sigma-54 dependent transcriptional regulator [Tautonia sociabilis]RUL84215.1 sigma-54-dependent Fis family transcriptional regulator [Tautonia sociabilis]
MPLTLVIDDDRSVQHLVTQALKPLKVDVLSAATAEEGLDQIRERSPDVVLLDIMLPETSGLELYRRVFDLDPKLPVIFITSVSSGQTAIEAIKLGAYDYIHKPLDVEQLREKVNQAVEIRRLMHDPVVLPHAGTEPTEGDLLVGNSPQMMEVYKAIGRVAPQDVTVLIRGESGTGKELVARAIYQHSRRAHGPFLAINCAAIPEGLLESELFGHEKGAFSGAVTTRIGKFEQCDGGTIFLDEIGDMTPVLQSKVLRLLQEKQFERVGGNKTIKVDVRIIAATHRDLEKMPEEKFRSDLYYRLNGFVITLPPVRDRGDDLLVLIDHFLRRFNRELGKQVQGLSGDALKRMMRYGWPGNVRELQSVLRQAMLQSTGPVLITDFLPADVRSGRGRDAVSPGEGSVGTDLDHFIRDRLAADSKDLYAEAIEFLEGVLLRRVLSATGGNQSRAAEILGIARGSLRNKIRALGITIDRVVSGDSDDDTD